MKRVIQLVLLTVAVALPLAGQTVTGLKLSGYAEASYVSSNHAAGDVIVGRLYDRFNDQFMLNALSLTIDKPFDPTRRSTGVHAEVLFGQNATFIQSFGFNLGAQGDVPQLYVTFNLPTANKHGVQFKVGRMATLMGLEALETTVNPNWSEGNQFVYAENVTGLGLSIETRFNDKLDAQLRVMNGWDQVREINNGKSFMARVGIAPDTRTSVAVVGFIGPELAGNTSLKRSGIEVLVSRKLGKTSLSVQGDLGNEDPTFSWSALGIWVTQDLSRDIGLSLRGDYLNDQDGARTSGANGFAPNAGNELSSLTATLNIRSWPSALIRPEVRYDHSNLLAFDGNRSQISVALSVAYLF